MSLFTDFLPKSSLKLTSARSASETSGTRCTICRRPEDQSSNVKSVAGSSDNGSQRAETTTTMPLLPPADTALLSTPNPLLFALVNKGPLVLPENPETTERTEKTDFPETLERTERTEESRKDPPPTSPASSALPVLKVLLDPKDPKDLPDPKDPEDSTDSTERTETPEWKDLLDRTESPDLPVFLEILDVLVPFVNAMDPEALVVLPDLPERRVFPVAKESPVEPSLDPLDLPETTESLAVPDAPDPADLKDPPDPRDLPDLAIALLPVPLPDIKTLRHLVPSVFVFCYLFIDVESRK